MDIEQYIGKEVYFGYVTILDKGTYVPFEKLQFHIKKARIKAIFQGFPVKIQFDDGHCLTSYNSKMGLKNLLDDLEYSPAKYNEEKNLGEWYESEEVVYQGFAEDEQAVKEAMMKTLKEHWEQVMAESKFQMKLAKMYL